VLTLIESEGPASQQRLADRVGVDRTTMVALVDALEEKGLVNRLRDPAIGAPTYFRPRKRAARDSETLSRR